MKITGAFVAAAAALWVGALAASRPPDAQSTVFASAGCPPTDAHAALSMFTPSTECLACHNNLTGPDGEDVSIGASWRGSMMANSARDPYVLASVRRETIDHASHASEIEDECAACHMPAARQIAHALGTKAAVLPHHGANAAPAAGPALAAGDIATLGDLARDGVACTVCHQIGADRLGSRESFNGNFVVSPPLANGRRRAFGPFQPDSDGAGSCRR